MKWTEDAPMMLKTMCWSFCLSSLFYSSAANSGDITLQVGKKFSVYAPPSCNRLDNPKFSLVLDCNFRSKIARFYMKEYPGQLGEEFNPREFPPSSRNRDALLNNALHAVADDVDPELNQQLQIYSWGSILGNASDGGTGGTPSDASLWEEGYIFNGSQENITKCFFLRMRTYSHGGGTSVILFAISDLAQDSDQLQGRKGHKCQGVPAEVITIASSVGGTFEGNRWWLSAITGAK